METNSKASAIDLWCEKQKELESRSPEPLFNEREVWWCAFGANIGSEQDGMNELFERPALVIKKFYGNMLLVLPLTSKTKQGSYYFQLNKFSEKPTAILSQMRTISNKRLLRKIGKISIKDYACIMIRLLKILL